MKSIDIKNSKSTKKFLKDIRDRFKDLNLNNDEIIRILIKENYSELNDEILDHLVIKFKEKIGL